MLTASQWFDAFNRSGFLDDCTWVPSNGSPAQAAMVNFRPSQASLLGDSVSGVEYEMTYQKELLAGLQENERVTIKGVTYRVREVRPAVDADITVVRLGLFS